MLRTALLALLLALVVAAPAGALQWQHVDSPGMGRMAVDPSGDLWLATGDTLSRWNGSGWSTETIPYSVVKGSATLAFSSDGRPHIVTHDLGSYVRYYTKDASGWRRELVTANSWGVGASGNIAVDASGRPHVTYCQKDTHYLYLASRGLDGSWTTSLVDGSNTNAAWWPDLAIDSQGRFYIAYTTGNEDDMRLVSGTPGHWQSTTLDSTMAWAPRIQLTSDDRIRIAYFNEQYLDYRLMYEAPGPSYRKFDFGSTSAWEFQHCMTLVNNASSFMFWTQNPTRTEPYPSKVYGCWVKDNYSIELFEVGGGAVISQMQNSCNLFPYVDCAFAGGSIYVNVYGIDGTRAETWYAVVPEPSCFAGLAIAFAGLAVTRRRR